VILVDSSVWIDYFRGESTPKTNRLDSLLATNLLAIGDLMLAEVLQGFTNESEFNRARIFLSSRLYQVQIGGADIAIQAARNFRVLRGLGITVRKTIDTLVATYCIENDITLLHNDRDFDAFSKHLSLKVDIEGD
jgi:predicted nucleic acid-binding protein